MGISVEVLESRMFASGVADEIIQCSRDAKSDGVPFSLSLSGGRTPGSIYRALTISPRSTAIDWVNTKLFLGDERWVPFEDGSSNYRMVNETLLKSVSIPPENVFPINTALDSEEAGALDYSKIIEKEVPVVDGAPRFELILLGLGEDGHIASLFPGSKNLTDTESLAVVSTNPNDNTQRVSIAPKVILNARKILVLVKGEGKQEILKKFLTGDGDINTLPALMLNQIADKVTVFADSEAVVNLPRNLIENS